MTREGRTFDVVTEAIAADAPDDDVAGAFEEWRKDLGDSEAPGMIRAYRIPIDEQGRASHSATGQIRLGSWPIDQYDFDALCQIIMKEYMLPNERIMAVRLIGTLTGAKGIRFNKIVQLQRQNQSAVVPTDGKNPMADVVRAMQESNERMMKMISEMGGQKAGGSGGDEMMRTVAMMRTLMEPMQQMMGPILAAVIGRPPPAAGPGGGLKETLESMMLMDRFFGRRGGEGGSKRSDFAEIATAVSGVAKPLLEMAAANAQAGLRQRRKPPALPNPTVAPTPAPPQNAPVQPAQTAQPQVVMPMDIPSSSTMPNMVGVDTSKPSVPNTGEQDPMFAEMKRQVDTLITMASQGSNPVSVGDLFYDQTMKPLPDDAYGQLAMLVEDENFMGKISLFNPAVSAHTDWFKQFRDQLVKRIVEADSGSDS